jgi:hypothetical protein
MYISLDWFTGKLTGTPYIQSNVYYGYGLYMFYIIVHLFAVLLMFCTCLGLTECRVVFCHVLPVILGIQRFYFQGVLFFCNHTFVAGINTFWGYNSNAVQ